MLTIYLLGMKQFNVLKNDAVLNVWLLLLDPGFHVEEPFPDLFDAFFQQILDDGSLTLVQF